MDAGDQGGGRQRELSGSAKIERDDLDVAVVLSLADIEAEFAGTFSA